MQRISGPRAALVALSSVLATVVSLAWVAPVDAASVTPRAGQCHRVAQSRLGLASDTKAPVPCGRQHDLLTIGVVTPSAPLTPTMTLAQLGVIGAAACRPVWDRFFHVARTTSALTILSEVFFSPTPAQVRTGQSWVRCDVGVVGKNGRLATTKGKLKPAPIVRHRTQAKNALCMTKGYLFGSCSYKHALREIKVLVLPGGTEAPYPGQKSVESTTWSRCPEAAVYVTWPTQQTWASGSRLIRCWRKG